MKTPATLLLLCLPACFPTSRPLAPAPLRPAPVAPADTAGTAYAEAEARRCAEWDWYAGGGR